MRIVNAIKVLLLNKIDMKKKLLVPCNPIIIFIRCLIRKNTTIQRSAWSQIAGTIISNSPILTLGMVGKQGLVPGDLVIDNRLLTN